MSARAEKHSGPGASQKLNHAALENARPPDTLAGEKQTDEEGNDTHVDISSRASPACPGGQREKR
jgi:hypothetical protein